MDAGDRRGVDRLTIQEAARRLGISEGAVRKRVTRKTLGHDKEDDGRVYVYLDARDRRGVDNGQDTGVDPNSNALISRLEGEVAFLRDQVQRQQEIIAQQAVTMRQLTASSQEPSEDAETVEEAPEGAEPRSATEEAQEGTEHLRQRGGWLAPVDKLPWWHYAIGLFLGFLAGFLTALVIEATIVPSSLPTFEFVLAIIAITAVTAWWPPAIFGLWIGYRKRDLRFWSQVLPLGALVGGVTSLGAKVELVGLDVGLLPELYSPDSTLIFVLPACMFFVSASLIGNAWQRRRIGRVFGTTPGSPISRATQGAGQQPRRDLTPTRQAMLGWGGAIISALISLVGTIITAMMMSVS